MGNRCTIVLPFTLREIKVIYAGQGRRMYVKANEKWDNLETILCRMYGIQGPLGGQYYDSSNTPIIIESTIDLKFFLRDKGKLTLNLFNLNDKSMLTTNQNNLELSSNQNSLELCCRSNYNSISSNWREDSPDTLKGEMFETLVEVEDKDGFSLKKLSTVRKVYGDSLDDKLLDCILLLISDQHESGVEMNFDVIDSTLRKIAHVESCPSLALPSLAASIYSLSPVVPDASPCSVSLIKQNQWSTELPITSNDLNSRLSHLSFNIPPPPNHDPPSPPLKPKGFNTLSQINHAMTQLRVMGFHDRDANFTALYQCDGSIQNAVAILLRE